MGEVYRGAHVAPGSQAAVKVLHPYIVENPEHLRRFLREAEVAAAIGTSTRSSSRAGETERARPSWRWSCSRATTSAGTSARGQALAPRGDRARRSARRALVAMREAGVVHRDLKPGNLFLTDSIPPRWKVLDFGLSKVVGTSDSLTRDRATRDAFVHGARAGERRASITAPTSTPSPPSPTARSPAALPSRGRTSPRSSSRSSTRSPPPPRASSACRATSSWRWPSAWQRRPQIALRGSSSSPRRSAAPRWESSTTPFERGAGRS